MAPHSTKNSTTKAKPIRENATRSNSSCSNTKTPPNLLLTVDAGPSDNSHVPALMMPHLTKNTSMTVPPSTITYSTKNATMIDPSITFIIFFDDDESSKLSLPSFLLILGTILSFYNGDYTTGKGKKKSSRLFLKSINLGVIRKKYFLNIP